MSKKAASSNGYFSQRQLYEGYADAGRQLENEKKFIYGKFDEKQYMQGKFDVPAPRPKQLPKTARVRTEAEYNEYNKSHPGSLVLNPAPASRRPASQSFPSEAAPAVAPSVQSLAEKAGLPVVPAEKKTRDLEARNAGFRRPIKRLAPITPTKEAPAVIIPHQSVNGYFRNFTNAALLKRPNEFKPPTDDIYPAYDPLNIERNRGYYQQQHPDYLKLNPAPAERRPSTKPHGEVGPTKTPIELAKAAGVYRHYKPHPKGSRAATEQELTEFRKKGGFKRAVTENEFGSKLARYQTRELQDDVILKPAPAKRRPISKLGVTPAPGAADLARKANLPVIKQLPRPKKVLPAIERFAEALKETRKRKAEHQAHPVSPRLLDSSPIYVTSGSPSLPSHSSPIYVS